MQKLHGELSPIKKLAKAHFLSGQAAVNPSLRSSKSCELLMNRFKAKSPAPAFCFGISNDKKMSDKGVGKKLEADFALLQGFVLW